MIDFYLKEEPNWGFDINFENLLRTEILLTSKANAKLRYDRTFRMIKMWLATTKNLPIHCDSFTHTELIKYNICQELDDVIKWYCKYKCLS